jgi:hypothetical protein
VELGERLYDGKLELVNDDIDVFGRPARTWKYNGGEVGTYAKKELLVNGGTYTAAVSGRDLYELLGQTTIRDNDLDSYLDGAENGVAKTELVRSNTKAVNDSARGVLTEVYLDNDNDRITIVSINTYLAKANSDYSSESETLSLTVYNSASGISKLVDLEDVASIANIKRDDWVLVNWADASKEAENKTVVDMMDVEILTDRTVTRFSMDNEEDNSTYPQEGTRIKSITTDGTEYKNNVNAYYKATTLNDYNKDLLVDKTYNIYLDQYGNFIGAELYSGKDQYVFITGYDRPESSIAVSTATANAIFTDGTMKNIKVNVKSTNENIASRGDENYTAWAAPGQNHEEMWYSYTLRDDIYTLTPAERYTYQQNDNAADATIDTSNVRLVPTGRKGTGYSYGEDESAYITVNMGDVDRDDDYLGIDEVTGIYTGIQEVKLVYGQNDWVHAVYDEDSFIIAAVVLGEAEGIADNYAYILGKTNAERYEDGVHYWEFEAIMGGKKQTMTVEDRFNNTVTKLKAGTIQELVLNADGNVVTIRDLPNSRTSASSEIETASVSGGYESDKIYTNFDFISTEGDSQDHADYNAYLIDVGGNGFGLQARYGAAALGSVAGMNGSATPYNANLYYTDIALSGRSLHYGAHIDTNDMGLLFAKEAPAFISREINNERKVYSYGSVAEAFSALQDADRDPSTNSSSGDLKQFSGIVAAVLDTKGVAQWVFFYDNTPVNGKDNGDNTLTGNVDAANGEPINPNGRTYGSISTTRLGDVSMNVTFTAPDWAAVNDNTEVDFTVTISDDKGVIKVLDEGDFDASTTASNFSYTVKSASVSDMKNAINEGRIDSTKLKAVISGVKWTYAAVEYQYEDGTEIDAANIKAAGGSSAAADKMALANTGAAFGFQFKATGDQTVGADATYAITGAAVATGDSTKLTDALTDSTDVNFSKIYAKGGEKVIVTIKGVTVTEPPETEKYSVVSKADDAIEFIMVDAVPGSDAIPATGWASSLSEVEPGKFVLVRSAGADALAASNGLVASNIYNMDVFPQAAVSPAITVNSTLAAQGVYAFAMPTCNVAIAAVKTNKIVVSHGFVESDGTAANTKVNLLTAEAPTTLDTDAKKVEFAAKWINEKVAGMTAKADTDFVGNDVLILTKNGRSLEVPVSNVTINNTGLFWATVDGSDYVAADSTALKTGELLAKVKTTAEVTALGDYYVKVTATNNDVSAQKASDTTNALTAGDVIDTNGGKGYIKLTTTVANDATNSPATMLDSGTVSGEPKNASDGFTVTTTQYVKKDVGELAINLKISTDKTMADTGKKLQAKVEGTTGATVAAATGVDYTNFADVADIVTGYEWKAADAKTVTIKVTPTGEDVTLTVTLAAVAQ